MDDAKAAFERGDYAQAFKIFKSLAAQGDASAQSNLGVMYGTGRGVTQDAKAAFERGDYAQAFKIFKSLASPNLHY